MTEGLQGGTEAQDTQEPGKVVPITYTQPVRIAAIAQRVQALVDSGEIKQADICREIGQGVSTGTLSAFLKNRYTGDSEAVAAKLERWLANRNAKAEFSDILQPGAIRFVETPTAKKILAVCSYTHLTADLAVIYGGAGVGKSEVMKHYAATNNNVWRVEMTRATSSMSAALDRICGVVGGKRYVQRPNYLEEQIVNKVRGTGGVLLVDEAQHLHTDALEAIRGLHDAAGIGLVMSGNETVYSRLTGSGARSAEFAQLFSRIGKRLRLNKPQAGDVRAIAIAWGITGRAEHEILEAIAAKPGALRGCVKTLRQAALLNAGKAITVEDIHAAWVDLSAGGME